MLSKIIPCPSTSTSCFLQAFISAGINRLLCGLEFGTAYY
jgi:hypothetical protein